MTSTQGPINSHRRRHRVRTEAEEQAAIKKKAYEENLKMKAKVIEAEFEKHKKEIQINFSDVSKTNEAKMKGYLDEIVLQNNTRKNLKKNLEEQADNLENQIDLASRFDETYFKYHNSFISKEDDNNIHLATSFNRTTSSFMPGYTPSIESLENKLEELQDTYNSIVTMIEKEKETASSVQDMHEEIKKDMMILAKRNNELQKMHVHAEMRFRDLLKVEILAKNKCAQTIAEYESMKESLNDMKLKEKEYLDNKKEFQQVENAHLQKLQKKVADTMIEIENGETEHIRSNEILDQLDKKLQIMAAKREEARDAAVYVDVFEKLAALIDIPEVKDAKRDSPGSQRGDDDDQSESPHSATKGRAHKLKVNFDTQLQRRNSFRTSSNTRTPELSRKPSVDFRVSSHEKRDDIHKILGFGNTYVNGVEGFVTALLNHFEKLVFRENSLRKIYQDYQDQKTMKFSEYESLRIEADGLKKKIGSDLEDFDDEGDDETTNASTTNQENQKGPKSVKEMAKLSLNIAKIAGEHRDHDVILSQIRSSESFMFRIYLDVIESTQRIAKLITVAAESNAYIAPELETLSQEIMDKLNEFKIFKKEKRIENTISQTYLPTVDKSENAGGTSGRSNRDDFSSIKNHEIIKLFMNNFIQSAEDEQTCLTKASEFLEKIRQDSFITTFISYDDIKSYLGRYREISSVQEQSKYFFQVVKIVDRAFNELDDLRCTGIDSLISRLKIFLGFEARLINTLTQKSDDLEEFLYHKGVALSDAPFLKRKLEISDYTKHQNEKKLNYLSEKYGFDLKYDFRDYMTHEPERVEPKEQRDRLKPREPEPEEIPLEDDNNIKINLEELAHEAMLRNRAYAKVEIKNPFYKKKLTKEEVRIMQKQEEERQNEIRKNMQDDSYIDDLRDQIKENEEKKVRKLKGFDNVVQIKKVLGPDINRLSSIPEPTKHKKWMIEDDKFLSKINLLEKQKSVADGKKAAKQFFLENYIPAEPKRPQTQNGANSTKSSTWKNKFDRTIKTRDSVNLSPDAHMSASDFEHFGSKPHTTKAIVSKFRPNWGDDESRPSDQGLKLQMQRSSTHSKEEDSPLYTKTKPIVSRSQAKLINTLNSTYDKKFERGSQKNLSKSISKVGTSSTKSKSSNASSLPRIQTSQGSNRKNVAQIIKNNLDKNDLTNLNMLLSINSDPLLGGVYSPSYFTTQYSSFPLALAGDFSYRYDSYNVKIPSLLVGDH